MRKPEPSKRWRDWWSETGEVLAVVIVTGIAAVAVGWCVWHSAASPNRYAGWEAYIELPSADVIYGTVDWAKIYDNGVIHASIDGVEYATSDKLFVMWKGEADGSGR